MKNWDYIIKSITNLSKLIQEEKNPTLPFSACLTFINSNTSKRHISGSTGHFPVDGKLHCKEFYCQMPQRREQDLTRVKCLAQIPLVIRLMYQCL